MSFINKGEFAPPASAVNNGLREAIRKRYSDLARQITDVGSSSCCGSFAGQDSCKPATPDFYRSDQIAGIPREVLDTSLGCGNPTALAELHPGEVVLDLGSGGGIDVLLSANRVGPTGKVYGIDMSDDMLRLARDNQIKAGIDNVEFLRGDIENIPLPDGIVDVIISNCVINLSINKDLTLAEAFRVLKPGGRFAVSDIVFSGKIPGDIRKNVELWIGCVAGALDESEYKRKLEKAGFIDISIEPTRIYDLNDAKDFCKETDVGSGDVTVLEDGKIVSAFVRARKPS